MATILRYDNQGLAFDHEKMLAEFLELRRQSGTDFYRLNVNRSARDLEEPPLHEFIHPNNRELLADYDIYNSDAVFKYMRTWSTDTVIDRLKGSYTEAVLHQLDSFFLETGERITVVKYVELFPRICYAMHRDCMIHRYHVPVRTNPSAFFINDGVLEQMPDVGRLFRIQADIPHTALNAGTESRIHLILDTCRI